MKRNVKKVTEAILKGRNIRKSISEALSPEEKAERLNIIGQYSKMRSDFHKHIYDVFKQITQDDVDAIFGEGECKLRHLPYKQGQYVTLGFDRYNLIGNKGVELVYFPSSMKPEGIPLIKDNIDKGVIDCKLKYFTSDKKGWNSEDYDVNIKIPADIDKSGILKIIDQNK